jgi:hypothetical protein
MQTALIALVTQIDLQSIKPPAANRGKIADFHQRQRGMHG